MSPRDIPTVVGAQLARTLRALRPDYKLYSEKRREIQDKHVRKDEDGAWVRSDSGGFVLTDAGAHREELTPLLEDEIEIDVPPVSLKRLQKECRKTSPLLLEPLLWTGVLVDDAEEVTKSRKERRRAQAGE